MYWRRFSIHCRIDNTSIQRKSPIRWWWWCSNGMFGIHFLSTLHFSILSWMQWIPLTGYNISKISFPMSKNTNEFCCYRKKNHKRIYRSWFNAYWWVGSRIFSRQKHVVFFQSSGLSDHSNRIIWISINTRMIRAMKVSYLPLLFWSTMMIGLILFIAIISSVQSAALNVTGKSLLRNSIVVLY